MQGLWSSGQGGVGGTLESGWSETQYTIPRSIYHMNNCSGPIVPWRTRSPLRSGWSNATPGVLRWTFRVSQRGWPLAPIINDIHLSTHEGLRCRSDNEHAFCYAKTP
jgi:hypothetical protein